MNHTAWTGMLAPALLDTLVEANKVAGLDTVRAHRCLLRQVKLFANATRDLYRYLRMREIRGNLALPYSYAPLVQNTANAAGLGLYRVGRVYPRRQQRTWTSGPSWRVSPRANYLHALPDGLMTIDWNRKTNLHHAGNGQTHLRVSPGLGLLDNDITAAA